MAGPGAKKSAFFARAPPAKKVSRERRFGASQEKNAVFHARTRIFIKKMTPRNPTPTDSEDHGPERTLLWPIARHAWRYSKALLDVQVGNGRENTFALQARLPRVTCDT